MSQALLARVANGDAAAVREALDTWGGLVWSIARRMLGTTQDAEDAVQEAFIELWRHAGRFDESLGTEAQFVATIARRRIIDRMRRNRARPAMEALPETLAAVAEGEAESLAERADESERAQWALAKLGADQQQVIRLAVLEGQTHTEVAAATGLPLGTVKTHVRRGLIRLRKLLEEDGDLAPGTARSG